MPSSIDGLSLPLSFSVFPSTAVLSVVTSQGTAVGSMEAGLMDRTQDLEGGMAGMDPGANQGDKEVPLGTQAVVQPACRKHRTWVPQGS